MKKVYMTPLTEVEIITIDQSILTISSAEGQIKSISKSSSEFDSDEVTILDKDGKLLESDDEELDEIW